MAGSKASRALEAPSTSRRLLMLCVMGVVAPRVARIPAPGKRSAYGPRQPGASDRAVARPAAARRRAPRQVAAEA